MNKPSIQEIAEGLLKGLEGFSRQQLVEIAHMLIELLPAAEKARRSLSPLTFPLDRALDLAVERLRGLVQANG